MVASALLTPTALVEDRSSQKQLGKHSWSSAEQEEFMIKTGGSRYFLGRVKLSEITALKEGEQIVLTLNHDESNVVQLAPSAVKSVFSRAKKGCELKTQRILVDVGDGMWMQSAFLTVKVIPPHVVVDGLPVCENGQ